MENWSNLSSLVGKVVRIDRGGPESRSGRLLAVKPDHLVLYCENEGVIYYKTDHIKSLTVDSQSNQEEGNGENLTPNYIEAETFGELLKNMQLRWVQVNRGGPEKIEGVLVDCNDDELVLTTNKEIVRVFNFHVRNISYGVKPKQQNQDKEKGKDDGKEKNQGGDAAKAQDGDQETNTKMDQKNNNASEKKQQEKHQEISMNGGDKNNVGKFKLIVNDQN